MIVISGATGCGKTTQVPQIIMDSMIEQNMGAYCNMICTQPRRISAIGVAERVAAERLDVIGNRVGYQIRLESKRSKQTRLLFCTTGILLRRLIGDPNLAGVSHIFVDEIHERDLDSDFLLIILKDLLSKNQHIKLVLMSATLNADLFSHYFNDCPVIHIEGRAFPVQAFFLEDALEQTRFELSVNSEYAKTNSPKRSSPQSDSENNCVRQDVPFLRSKYPNYSQSTIRSMSRMDFEQINLDLIEYIIKHIHDTHEEGAILVFLPGIMEISKLYDRLRSKREFSGQKFAIFPLHSTLSSLQQRSVFDALPRGTRKVVLSTNIAETSITIDDVVFVIDSGKVKETRFDNATGMSMLVQTWVSQASAMQRRGRAGRVKPGICYHLFPSHLTLQEFQEPEILRVPLEHLCLQIEMLGVGPSHEFLQRAVTPPSQQAIDRAVLFLQEIQAMDHEQHNLLTPLGFHLGTLPLDVKLGKMLVFGALLGCLDPILTIASTLATKSPFVAPFEKRELADQAKK